jgi:hypothetical protein
MLYARLQERRVFAAAREEAIAAALELLPGLWSDALETAAGQSFQRLQGLVRLLGGRWLEPLRRFVVRDVQAIFDAEVEPVAVESACSVLLPLDEKRSLRAFGRFDRVLRGRERTFVDDYKTAGNLSSRSSPASFLKGRNLQLPLYREIVARATDASPETVRARCLGVGPDFDDDLGSAAELAWDPKVRAGFLETLGVCLDLARGGRFPLNAASPRCAYCAYRSTCRRTHEPTLERLGNDPSLRDYFDLQEKTRSETTLEEVRRKRRAADSRIEGDAPDGEE